MQPIYLINPAPDPQKDALYAFEQRHLIGSHNRMLWTVSEIAGTVDRICEAEGIDAPSVVEYAGNGLAFAHQSNDLLVPHGGIVIYTDVLHELAHKIAGLGIEPHGAEFVATFLRLLDDHANIDMYAHAVEFGLAVAS